MNYTFCYYRGCYVYSTKEYVNSFRANFFNVFYDVKKRKKMLEEIEKIIDFNSSVDLYAYAQLLFDDRSKDSISKCYNILDIISSWNYIPAKYLLGQLYFYGLGVKTDLKKFYSLSLEAANEDFVPGKNAVALALLNGYGCKVDCAKGRKILDECAAANYGTSLFNIGVGYYHGSYGYPNDMYKAFEYTKKASAQFHKGASFNLGLMYLIGEGCTKDVEKGLNELVNAAYLGHLKAQKKAADSYYFGKITKRKPELAYELYMMAAEQGDAYSMYSVGYMILNNEKPFGDRYVGIDGGRKAANKGWQAAIDLLKDL